MRKELLVYVSTIEKGEEISVTSVSSNRAFVLINTPNGKIAVNRSELASALDAIVEFDKTNNANVVELNLVPNVLSFQDVEYVTEE